jgi:predicted  nucleic acid-binding Zn-ribbon protein
MQLYQVGFGPGGIGRLGFTPQLLVVGFGNPNYILDGRDKLLEQLRHLVELQFLMDKKAGLIRSREEAPLCIAELEGEFAQFESESLLKKTEYDNAVKMRRALEHEVKDLESRLARSKTRSNEVKDNREYKAVLKEIKDLERSISSKEDQILNCMETIERLETEVKELTKELEKRKEKLVADKEQVNLQGLQVNDRLAKLEMMQQAVRAKLDEAIMQRYDFLLEKCGNIAIAALQNGICQVCHLNIPPQKFIEVQRDEAIHTCPHCQRFVYWAESDAYLNCEDEFPGI